MKKMMCEAQAQAVMMMEANMAKQVTRWKEDLKKEKEKKEKEKSAEGADTQDDWPEPDIGQSMAPAPGPTWGSFNEALLLEMNRRDDISAGGSSPSSAPGPGWGSFISAGGSSPSSSSTCRVKGTGKKICLPVMKEKRKKDKDDWGP
jgi:hypothetical protein